LDKRKNSSPVVFDLATDGRHGFDRFGLGHAHSICIASCLAAFCLVLLSSQSLADDTKYHTEILLKQRGRMLGDELVYLSPAGMRAENPHSKVIVVAKAPDWTIYKFCPGTKRFTQEHLQGLTSSLNKTNALFGGLLLIGATTTKVAECRIFGYAGTEYKEDKQFAQKGLAMRKAHNVNGDYPRAFQYRILDPTLFPKEEAHIMSILHAVPDLNGIPVSMRCESYEYTSYNFLTTSSIEPMTLARSQFDLPGGFQRVKEESQLTTDSETESALMNLMSRPTKEP